MNGYLGDFVGTETVPVYFSTHAAAGGNVAPLSAFEVGDVRIYKNGSDVQRTSSNGMAMTSPFDGLTGFHLVTIDLSDNSDAGFFAAGNTYTVVLAPDTETVDGQTITVVIGCFSIKQRSALRPATAGRDLVVDAAGLADANVVKLGPSGAGTAQTARDIGASVLVGDKTGFSLSAAGVAAIWDALVAGIVTAGSIGKRIIDYLTGDSFARLGAPAGASISADVAAVKGDTAAVKLKTDLIPAAGPADAAEYTAARAAKLDNLDVVLSTRAPEAGGNVAAIKLKTDALPSDPADASDVAASALAIYDRLGAPVGASVSADVAAVKAVVDAIKIKTDALPGDPGDESDLEALIGDVQETVDWLKKVQRGRKYYVNVAGVERLHVVDPDLADDGLEPTVTGTLLLDQAVLDKDGEQPVHQGTGVAKVATSAA